MDCASILMLLANSKHGIEFADNIKEFTLTNCLTRRFGGNYFPFSRKYEISNLPKRQETVFANFTFPSNIRTIEIPNFFDYKPFVDDILEIFTKAHEMTKKDLSDLRRSL